MIVLTCRTSRALKRLRNPLLSRAPQPGTESPSLELEQLSKSEISWRPPSSATLCSREGPCGLVEMPGAFLNGTKSGSEMYPSLYSDTSSDCTEGRSILLSRPVSMQTKKESSPQDPLTAATFARPPASPQSLPPVSWEPWKLPRRARHASPLDFLAPMCQAASIHSGVPSRSQVLERGKAGGRGQEKAGGTGQAKINRQIVAPYVRLVTEEGHEVLSRADALSRATQAGLDLMEVNPRADPPVCRLVDHRRFAFELRKKEKEQRKRQVEKRRMDEIKDIRISPRVERKDLEMKADMAKRHLERGHRVKCTLLYQTGEKRGEEGEKKLQELLQLLEGVSKQETSVRNEGHKVWSLLRPIN